MSAGRFGAYGGQYVPETLMPCLIELEDAYRLAQLDPSFERELNRLLTHYSGRPTPLYLAGNFSDEFGNGAKVYLKREDLNHTGAHKINNCLGQGLLAHRMNKKRIVAETGAGQHGVATATVAALFNMECTIYMGEVDMERQHPNVVRMNLLGAEVVPVTSGSRTLKDATNETIRDWVTHVDTTHYIIGSTVGPHPYPTIVRDYQSVIGREAREQILAMEGKLPTDIVACVGGGSNALGIYTAFLDDEDVRLYGVEAAGSAEGHAAALGAGRPGVLHGALSYLMQDEHGQVSVAHSVAAGLDYPGVGPEHSNLRDSGRVAYSSVSDADALAAFALLSRCEGIIPALESAHAIAFAKQHLATGRHDGDIMIINLSGRGDKDVDSVKDKGVAMTLSEHTATLRSDGRKALVPFFTAGYPDDATFVDLVLAAADAGADVIEIGIPFSDPIADGPVIQASSTSALAAGMTLTRALDLATALSGRTTTPLVIMSYINPLLTYGLERFAPDAHAAGVRGLIAPDVSFEESATIKESARASGVDYIHLIAPTSSDERIATIAADAAGFIYLVSLTGVTGARQSLSDDLPGFIARVRARTNTPLYVGFGVSTPEQAAGVVESADGVIIGSRLIRLIDEGDRAGAPARVARLLGEVRRAIDN